ncbi:hypothetical protein E3U23_09290 [Erythrobacter litoralis]|uniref:hypothetical protein n=1 Tax=Erythrobacter litoralis TaxID=39960 RepID=UPI0024356C49|nr:hypothetical protein [Erythrobacter litoralis]MDG6079385.1 hypothetical protein [Erythrobacter litoralis]
MNALSHSFDRDTAATLPSYGPVAIEDLDALRKQWSALHEAAAAVCDIARIARFEPVESVLSLPERAEAVGGERYRMVREGVGDLVAIMQPGMRALLAVSAEDKETRAPAVVLIEEFHAARDAILSLVDVDDE